MRTNTKIIYIPDFLVILKSLEDNTPRTVSDIQYETKISYSHVFWIKKVLLEKGWILMNKNGMTHELSLTDKGREIVKVINMLLNKMEITSDNLIEYRQITKNKKVKEEVKEEEVKQEVVENEDINETVF